MNDTAKPIWHYCELYKMNFYFFIAWNEKAFLEYACKNYNYERKTLGDGVCLEIEHKDGSKGIVIWTRKRSLPEIAHEAVHAALYILEDKGIEFNYSQHEYLGYLVEYITRQALKKKQEEN